MVNILPLYLLVLNSVTFALYGYDKWLAKKHKNRISERNLLTATFFGGTIGALFGMFIFRHKISKRSFIFKLLAVILLQALTCYLIITQGLAK